MVLFAPWRRMLIPAAVVTVFISVGGVPASSFRHRLGDPGHTLTFLESITQVIGLVVALVFCFSALREAFGGRGARERSGRRADGVRS